MADKPAKQFTITYQKSAIAALVAAAHPDMYIVDVDVTVYTDLDVTIEVTGILKEEA